MQIQQVSVDLLPDGLSEEEQRALSREAVRRGVPLNLIFKEAILERARAINRAAGVPVPSESAQPPTAA